MRVEAAALVRTPATASVVYAKIFVAATIGCTRFLYRALATSSSSSFATWLSSAHVGPAHGLDASVATGTAQRGLMKSSGGGEACDP